VITCRAQALFLPIYHHPTLRPVCVLSVKKNKIQHIIVFVVFVVVVNIIVTIIIIIIIIMNSCSRSSS
jgi:hypothetical protein